MAERFRELGLLPAARALWGANASKLTVKDVQWKDGKLGARGQKPLPLADIARRAHADGRLRADFIAPDVVLLLESCAAIRVDDPLRTAQLRRRHLAILLAGLATTGTPLPGPPPRPAS